MYGKGKYRKTPYKGYKSKMSPTKRAYLAGVKAGMARAGKYRRSSRSGKWY